MTDHPSSRLAQIVRQFRVSAELSQEELASRSGLSPRQISDLERGMRVRPRIETIRLLADGLGLSGHRRAALFSAARPDMREMAIGDDVLVSGEPLPPFPLPIALTTPMQPIIGRDAVVASLVDMIRSGKHRLITLVGPGGVGKTRLAKEAVSIMFERQKWEVLFLPLASITNSELVAPAIGYAAGLTGVDSHSLADRLAAAFENRRLLLAVDNFEQILSAGPAVAQIVERCPSLQVLVTSRAPLHVSLEYEWPVAPLAVPEYEAPLDQLMQAPAARLFIERSTIPDDEIPISTISTVAAICRRLDGLPLAIELAAARTKLLSPAQLLDRMNVALPLLVGGPQDAPARLQTMSNAIAWSYDLLDPEKQRLFRVLSVFRGGFTLEAVEAVTRDSFSSPIAPLLEVLLDCHLVLRVESFSDTPRFSMLETVREFALDLLIATNEHSDVRDRHLAWLLDRIGPLSPDELFLGTTALQHFLPDEQGNLRSALEWALERNDPGSAVVVAHSLSTYLRRSGEIEEIASVHERISRASANLDPEVKAAVDYRLAGALYLMGEFEKCRQLSTESLASCRKLGSRCGICTGLSILGMVTRWHDASAALEMIEQVFEAGHCHDDLHSYLFDLNQLVFTHMVLGNIETASELLTIMLSHIESSPEVRTLLPRALANAGWVAGLQGNLVKAETLGLEALDVAFEFGFTEAKHFAFRILGEVELARENYTLAAQYFQNALMVVYLAGSRIWEGFSLAVLARVAQATGQARQAALLFGAAAANWDQVGIAPSARETMVSWGHNGSPSPEDLADPLFSAAFATGARLSRAAAYSEAMKTSFAS